MEQTNEKYLVYMHINKLNNKVYIGITSKLPHQRWGFNGRNYKIGHTAFYRALKKYPDWDNDWDHIVIKQDLTKDEACDMEVELIAKYKSNCCKYHNPSYGYNMTDGGEGRTGSYGMRGEDNPNYGRVGKLNPKSRGVYCVEDDVYFESLSIASKKYNLSTSQISHRCKTQSTYADIDKHFLYEEDACPELIARCLLQKRNYRVYCIDTKQWFEDANEASLYANVTVHSIRSSCKKLGQLAAGSDAATGESLHWLYEKDVNGVNIQNALDYKAYADKRMGHRVYCVETETYYKNVMTAAKEFNIRDSGIIHACAKIGRYSGVHPITGQQLHWLYAEDVNDENIFQILHTKPINHSAIQVYCYELDKGFVNIEIPAKALGIASKTIKKCIDDETDHAGRHPVTGELLHWIYLKNYSDRDNVEVLDEYIVSFGDMIAASEAEEMENTGDEDELLM